MSKNRVSNLSHESSHGMLEWEENWLFILKKKEKWVNRYLFPFLYIFISECVAEIKYKVFSPVYSTEKKQCVHTPTKRLGSQQFGSNTLEWLDVPCLHISTPFMALFLIISWRKRLHSGETLKCLSLHVNIKRDSEKWGGEHREPQEHRTMIQRNHIDILVEKWERNMSTENRSCFRTWLSKPSASRQWDPRSYRETRDDESSLCKTQIHGAYTHAEGRGRHDFSVKGLK